CAEAQFGTDDRGFVPGDAEDSESNPVHAVFVSDHDGEENVATCTNCGRVICLVCGDTSDDRSIGAECSNCRTEWAPTEPNIPTLYVDGEAVAAYAELNRSNDATFDPEELERVQVEFLDASNGVQSDAMARAPLGWCNSATIHLDRDDDAVHVLISVGDP